MASTEASAGDFLLLASLAAFRSTTRLPSSISAPLRGLPPPAENVTSFIGLPPSRRTACAGGRLLRFFRVPQGACKQADDFLDHLFPVRQVAQTARQPLNPLLLQQDQQQSADEEVIGPMDFGARMVRQYLPHRID